MQIMILNLIKVMRMNQLMQFIVRWMIVGAFRDEPIIVIVKDR